MPRSSGGGGKIVAGIERDEDRVGRFELGDRAVEHGRAEIEGELLGRCPDDLERAGNVETLQRRRGDVGANIAIGRRGARLEILEGIMEAVDRSEEHTSELQSLMRISYAVFCLKKKKNKKKNSQIYNKETNETMSNVKSED